MLDGPAATPPVAEALAAPPRAPAATAWRWSGRVLVLALVGSGLIHAAVIAGLVFWPVSDPAEEAGQLGSVALVFADTAAQAGGSAEAQAPPPTPPAPPVAPQPPAPPAHPQVAAPPPPPPAPNQPPAAAARVPAQPQAAAPPPAPPTPQAPRDVAALAPDPAGDLPAPTPPADPLPEPSAPPPPATEPAREPAIPPPPTADPAPEPAAPVAAPAPSPTAPPSPPPAPPTEVATSPEPPPPETRQAEAEPLPPPPPAPPPPPQQRAAAQPAPATPPRRQAPAAEGPIRLDAGAGALPEPSMGSFALGAVVPPGTDPGFRNNPPDYPEASRRRGEEGIVRLNLRVAPDGRVVAVEVTTSSGYAALDNAAIEAARGWRFRPAMRAGVPVVAMLTTALHFRLSEAGRR